MKIAVTYENGRIFQHFGHTEEFKIYETDNGEIISAEVISTDGQGHSALADFLFNNNISSVICGGIGGGAVNALAEAGIKVYAGVAGDADAAVIALLKNELDYVQDANCDHHHECTDHECESSCSNFNYVRKRLKKQADIKEETVMNEVCEFLKKVGTYYLATVDGDQPRVRPFGTANIFDGKLYIQTGKSKDVAKQLLANPKAEICAYAEGKWLRIAGELILDDRIEAKKSMLDAHPNLRAMYDENDDNTAVFYFKDATATFSSFTEAPKVVKF